MLYGGFFNTEMKIYFCQECGAYSFASESTCEECQALIPDDSWANVTQEELDQLDFVDDLDLPPGLPVWEYEVVRLKTDDDDGSLTYTTQLLGRMGEKGWELVDVVSLNGGSNTRFGVFKRCWVEAFEE